MKDLGGALARRTLLVALAIGSTMGIPFLSLETPCRSGDPGDRGKATLLRCLNCSKDIPASPKLVYDKYGLLPYHLLSWELAVPVLLFRWEFFNQLPLPMRSIGVIFFCSASYSSYSMVTRKQYRVRMIQWITPLPRLLLPDHFYMCLSFVGQSQGICLMCHSDPLR